MQNDSAADSGAPTTPATTPPAANWSELGLSDKALDLIQKAGFRTPTPVQAESIPYALDGFDVIASAQTGTGKTASFVLPMCEKLEGKQGTYGLILAPTREIAQQTQATIDLFGTPRGIRSIVLIGGIDMRRDLEAIQSYPQIIIATPGRLCDHLDRGNIWLDFIQMVVLDEADRMLDMGFSDQLSRIMQDVPSTRQTLLFSATFAAPVENLARRILHEPKRVAIGRVTAAKTVDQRILMMSEEAKNRELRKLLREEKGTIIVFTRSKDKATRVWRSLHSNGVYEATYIHSDRLQRDREQALADFKEGKFRILIATDVAGRGIHVDGVAHVVNYDLPMEPEDYVHRVGRTGRAEATGFATSFITPADRGMLKRIEKLLGKPLRIEESAPPRDRGARPSAPGSAGRVIVPRGPGSEATSADAPPRAPQPQREARPPREGGAPGESAEAGEKKGRRRRRGRRGGKGPAGGPAGTPGGSPAPTSG